MESGFISIDETVYPTLLAISEKEQAKGLMFQEWTPPVMSFIYRYARVNKFWMQNTPSPLDIIFCHKGKVVEICKGIPYSTEMIGSNNFSDLVIELPYGTAKQSNIKISSDVSIVVPTSYQLEKLIASKLRL